METKIVLGHAFGDEGKGVTVQYLCKKAIDEGKKPLVIRFSGGPQAAHTIQNDGITHICSTYGSGVLLDVPTLLMPSVYYDPICAFNEYEALKEKLGREPAKLYVSTSWCKVITPYDVLAGRSDEKVLKDGTCGKGIYPTFKRYDDYVVFGNPFKGPKSYIEKVRDYYHAKKLKDTEIKFVESIKSGFYDNFEWGLVNLKNLGYDVLIFEGSQGLLLDMDAGYFPNVTPSRTGLAAIPRTYLENSEMYLVTRTYLTRHGNGYTPYKRPLPYDLSEKFETNVKNPFQGEFKVGVFDFDILADAISRHRLDNEIIKHNIHPNLVITHFDLLNQCNDFYFLMGKKIDSIEYNDGAGRALVADFIRRKSSIDYENVYINESPESNLFNYKDFYK